MAASRRHKVNFLQNESTTDARTSRTKIIKYFIIVQYPRPHSRVLHTRTTSARRSSLNINVFTFSTFMGRL